MNEPWGEKCGVDKPSRRSAHHVPTPTEILTVDGNPRTPQHTESSSNTIRTRLINVSIGAFTGALAGCGLVVTGYTIAGQLVLGCLGAIVIHELGHVAAVLVVRGSVTQVTFGLFVSHTAWVGSVGPAKEAFVAVAGSTVNLVVALLAYSTHQPWASLIGYANVIVGLVNLIPIRGSDGAQIVAACKK